MTNLILLFRYVLAVLAFHLMLAAIEVSCGGKGKGGSDIILYKNNLLIRGEKGKGNLVIAEPHHHHHHHEHHGHHEEHHHGHAQHKSIMSLLGDSKGKGGKGKGKGGGNMVIAAGSTQKKGNAMGWEDLIMGGGKY